MVDSSVIVILVVVLSLIIFGMICMGYKQYENFSPTGWTQNCPPAKPNVLSPRMSYNEPWRSSGWINVDDDYIAGNYSPGSVFKCRNQKECAMLNIKGCPSKEDIPKLKENIPIGWGSTMTGPYAGNNCMSGINGVNKASMRNPYGKVYPEGNQMYGFCEKGVDNYFSD